jgi:MoaA/NifB/PqqE/SkfB family radical SAM enzyme
MNWLYSHSTLQIEPTRRCNLNCKICIRRNLNETTALLSLEDFKKILNSWNFQHVALHGWGEPLLNPELFQMVKYAESQGVSTELTTNATLLQTNIEKIFTSGLGIIVFGIHKKENLPVIMPQIKELIYQRNKEKLRKPRAYIDIVIYRGNQYEIMDLVEAAAELTVDAVVLHRVFNINKLTSPLCPPPSRRRVWPPALRGLCPGGEGEKNGNSCTIKSDPDVEYISIQGQRELFVKVKKIARQLKVRLYLPPEPSIPCRAVKHSIFITSEAKVTPCPYFPEFYLGDALNGGGLKEVIYSERYIDFIRNMDKHPVCSKCPLGSINGDFYT